VHLTLTNTKAEQVADRIWLPVESDLEGRFRDENDRMRHFHYHLVVDELRVNDPSIEELFEFEFPQGSMYYDHVLDSSIVVKQDVPLKTRQETLDREVGALADIYEKHELPARLAEGHPRDVTPASADSVGENEAEVVDSNEDSAAAVQEPWWNGWHTWAVAAFLIAAGVFVALLRWRARACRVSSQPMANEV
jgi:hypothetical protein